MGNTKDKTRPRKKNQPEQLLSSGEKEVVQAGGRFQSIEIKLVKLNLELLPCVKQGNLAIVVLEHNRYSCLFNSEKLGEVPQYYNSRMLPKAIYDARIKALTLAPASVTIELY